MLLRILVCFMFLFSSIAYSHGPTRQKVKESIDINASVEDTWKMVKNLGAY